MIVILAGGVGGARMARGIAGAEPTGDVRVIVNTADDFEHLGLSISPDLDTVMYTLAGLENAEQGWGLAGETWSFMASMQRLGGDTWFRLGDQDLATHIERTRRLAAGETLSQVTSGLCAALNIRARVLPMTDQRVRTVIDTDEGTLAFQDYFVRRQAAPRVRAIRFDGADEADASPACIEALTDPNLEAIILAPSNPFVSVAPILAIGEIRQALARRAAPLVAVSPLVGGKAIKGPAAKMMTELGHSPSALAVARHYRGLIDALVIDEADQTAAPAIAADGIAVHVCDTIMSDDDGRRRLGLEALAFARKLRATGGWRIPPITA